MRNCQKRSQINKHVKKNNILYYYNFCYKSLKFLDLEGSNHPLISTLFGLIILLVFVMVLFHKNNIYKIGLYKQTIIKDYF